MATLVERRRDTAGDVVCDMDGIRAPKISAHAGAAELTAKLALWVMVIVAGGAGALLIAARNLPVGAQIAFDAERNRDYDVYLMDVERQLIVNLTHHTLDDYYAAWSPDGRQLAFASRRDHGSNAEIYVMNSDGTGLQRITENRFNDVWPVWSPDGREIAYMSYRDGVWNIFVSSLTTGAEQLFSQHNGLYWLSEWSSDQEVTLVSNRHGTSDIYVMNMVDNNVRQITEPYSDEVQPAWSPDGAQIVFSSNMDGLYSLYLMNADGSGLHNLFSESHNEMFPNWSPDGTQLAYSTAQDGNLEIYILDLATGQQRRMTYDRGYDMRPVWRPNQYENR